MGLLRSLFKGAPDPLVEAAIRRPQFAVSVDPGTLYGVQSVDEALVWMQGTRRVSRREAITVPAVKRARDLIAGGLGQLPLRLYGPDGQPTDWSLLSQPEERIAPTVTWTNVVDDLIFDGVAFLRVTHVGWHGKPAQVVRLEPETCTYRPELRVYHTRTGNGTATEYVPDEQIIRIDSPNDPLLVAGARAIRALSRLEAAALNYAEGTPPMDWFTPADGMDPAEDEEIEELLDAWQTARRKRSTAYVPAALEYHANTAFNPEQLQLSQAREMAIGEIARLTGVDAEELSISTTSRTYTNQQDRRRQFTGFTIGPYRHALQGALSQDHVTPHGYAARFDLSEFEQADDKTTAETDEVLIRSGVMTVEEVRERRGLRHREETAPAPSRKEIAA